MKVHELLTVNEQLLKTMDGNGIKTEDWRYVRMYRDYETMRNNGDKVTYIATVLSERYGMSERTVYRALSMLGRECLI